MNVLIIGGTGYIGKEVVRQLIKERVSITLLVRDLMKSKTISEFNHESINFVKGDLTQINLGLNKIDMEKVMECDVIIHCGGPMDINLPKEIAKKFFLEGSKNVMTIANEINKKRKLIKIIHTVGYMSPFTDDSSEWENIDVFNEVPRILLNAHPYEQMKFLSDIYIRQEAKKSEIPLAVINLPTVVGNDQTGSPIQLGGFGLFVEIFRKRALPVVPGGKNFRLPLINRNVLAQFIVETVFSEKKEEMTYSLIADASDDYNIRELMQVISQSMNMKMPRFTAPFGFLKSIMKYGGSKVTGIPLSSLAFLTNKKFDNQLTKRDFNEELVNRLPVSNIQLSIAEIDFQLTYGDEPFEPYLRKSVDGFTYYYLAGKEKPIILIHGLMSDGTDFFEFGIELFKKTGRSIIIVDLPGFGRSPFIKHNQILQPYLGLVASIKTNIASEATFIGHSYGAALLVESFKREILSDEDEIILLQPPIKKIIPEPNMNLSKFLLKHVKENQLENYFYKNGLISNQDSKTSKYLGRVKKSFKSPRILNTTVLLNNELKKMDLNNFSDSWYVIWGTKDKSYDLQIEPKYLKKLSLGHQFPIIHPIDTAREVLELLTLK